MMPNYKRYMGYLGRICVLLALPGLLMGAAQDEPTPEPGSTVVICPIEGMIDDGTLILVERAVRDAKRLQAKAIIFDIDTPGGRVDSAVEVTQAILSADVHTIAYVSGGMGATSAGAIISYACNDIVMAPGTTIGASAVVMQGPDGSMQAAGEKATSFVREKIRSLAETNGHNPDIAEAMVDQDVELRAYREDGKLVIRASSKSAAQPTEKESASEETIDATTEEILERVLDGVTKRLREDEQGDQEGDSIPEDVRKAMENEGISEDDDSTDEAEVAAEPAVPVEEMADPNGRVVLARGKLLTLSADQAVAWGVTPITFKSTYEVLSYFEYSSLEQVAVVATWSEELFKWLISPGVSAILMLLGLGGLYLEVQTPGVGIPGFVGVTCLTLVFGARAVVGMAEWIDIALLVVGVGLIVVEVLILPGFGIPGLAGGVCLLLGLYLAFTRVTIPQYSWDYDRIYEMFFVLGCSMVGSLIIAYLGAKYLPRSPFYDRLILADDQNVNLGYVVQTAADEASVGMRGKAASNLRPAGRGRFGDTTYDVVSRGEFIDSGESIIIIRAEGNRYVVDPIGEDE